MRERNTQKSKYPDIQEIPINVLIQTWWNSKYTIYSTYSGNSIYFGTAYEKNSANSVYSVHCKVSKTKFQELQLKKKLFQNSDYSIILGGPSEKWIFKDSALYQATYDKSLSTETVQVDDSLWKCWKSAQTLDIETVKDV